ncbi:MAG: amidohydrolase family protein, partial [Phycisphaerales bacterium]|nr:amidohydrolase family protein [Phycisphaerales bacterium]
MSTDERRHDDSLLIKGGRLIDPAGGLDATGDLLLRNGCVADISTTPGGISVNADTRIVHVPGCIVCPGLIDIHVHLREPGPNHDETIRTGGEAAINGGFTTVCCMPNTTPALDNVAAIVNVERRAQEVGLCRVRVVAAATVARQGQKPVDFAAMVRAGAVAFSDDGDGIEDDAVCSAVMAGIKNVDSVLFPHCEFKALSHSGAVHLGPVSRQLGLVGYDPHGEEAMIERDLALVAKLGVRYHVAHVSTAKGIALIADAKRRKLPVTTEVCPHHLLLTDALAETYDPIYKVNPPLRTAADAEALRAGLADGTIDI